MDSSASKRLISEPTATLGGTVEEMHMERDAETERRIGQVFRTMLFFTTLMVLGPISTYFYSRTNIFEGKQKQNKKKLFNSLRKKKPPKLLFIHFLAYFGISKDQSYIYAVIAAVVVVHMIVGAFIYVAWQDANAKVIKKKKQ